MALASPVFSLRIPFSERSEPLGGDEKLIHPNFPNYLSGARGLYSRNLVLTNESRQETATEMPDCILFSAKLTVSARHLMIDTLHSSRYHGLCSSRIGRDDFLLQWHPHFAQCMEQHRHRDWQRVYCLNIDRFIETAEISSTR